MLGTTPSRKTYGCAALAHALDQVAIQSLAPSCGSIPKPADAIVAGSDACHCRNELGSSCTRLWRRRRQQAFGLGASVLVGMTVENCTLLGLARILGIHHAWGLCFLGRGHTGCLADGLRPRSKDIVRTTLT